MSDLISKEALLHIVGKMPLNWEYGQAVSDIYDIIENQPTIEAVPVVQSEWEICEEPNTFDTLGNPATYARCKNCGFTWRNKYHVNNYFKHCPNCGADMRKGGE